MKTFLRLFLIMSISSLACAQPANGWMRTYGGTQEDGCQFIQPLSDGGYAFAGYTESYGAGGYDVWLMRTSANGDSLWSRTYGGSGHDWIEDFHQTSDGGFVLVGWCDTYATSERVMRLNANGDTLWTQIFDHGDTGAGNFVEETADGGIAFFGGMRVDPPGTARDIQLVIMDRNGAVLQTRVFGGPMDDTPLAVKQNADGGYTLLAKLSTDHVGGWDLWVMHTDSAGDSLQCIRQAMAHGFSSCHQTRFTADGGFVICGLHERLDHETFDRWLMKADATGQMLWSRLYESQTGIRTFTSVQQLDDGGYILAGNATFMRLDALGNVLWQRNVEPVADYEICCVEPTADNAFVLGGCYYNHHDYDTDAWLLMTAPVVSANPGFIPYPSSLSLSCAPNPFNPQTRITFTLPQTDKVHLGIFDVLGQQLATLHDGILSAGEHTIAFDGSQLSAGIYFARVLSPHRQATLKLMLIK